MRLIKDLWEMFGGLVLGILTIALVLFVLVGGISAIVNHSEHVSCLRLHEQTGLETHYARSGIEGECYIRINGVWVPEDRWRNIGED